MKPGVLAKAVDRLRRRIRVWKGFELVVATAIALYGPESDAALVQ